MSVVLLVMIHTKNISSRRAHNQFEIAVTGSSSKIMALSEVLICKGLASVDSIRCLPFYTSNLRISLERSFVLKDDGKVYEWQLTNTDGFLFRRLIFCCCFACSFVCLFFHHLFNASSTVFFFFSPSFQCIFNRI